MERQPTVYQPREADRLHGEVFRTRIEGLYYVAPNKFDDERGFFAELARLPELEAVRGVPFNVRQINHSRSGPGVVRGLHAEGWNKLVTVAAGVAFSALADVRAGSPTFGVVELFRLGKARGGESLPGSLFISQGIANSVCVLAAPMDYVYCVDLLYSERDRRDDVAIALFDPDLAIPWPIPRDDMVLSRRDVESVTLRARFPAHFAE